jgi:hypothetical protein
VKAIRSGPVERCTRYPPEVGCNPISTSKPSVAMLMPGTVSTVANTERSGSHVAPKSTVRRTVTSVLVRCTSATAARPGAMPTTAASTTSAPISWGVDHVAPASTETVTTALLVSGQSCTT